MTIYIAPVKPELDSRLGLGDDASCTLKFVINRRQFCSQPAEWACQLACCGSVKVVCDTHRDPVASVAPKIFMCTHCRAERPAIASQWRI